MTSLDTDTSLVADLDAIDAHSKAVDPLHIAAWRGPVVDDYATGATVWMWDHYNTAVVLGAGARPGTWRIETQSADGSIDRYTYPSEHLRPAARPMVFVWHQSN